MVLGDGTGFVGAEQITQGVGLSLEFGADVSLGDLDAGVHALKDRELLAMSMFFSMAVFRPQKGSWETMRSTQEL